MNELTHFDSNGNAIMVDVSQKNETERIATACSIISISKETLECIGSETDSAERKRNQRKREYYL